MNYIGLVNSSFIFRMSIHILNKIARGNCALPIYGLARFNSTTRGLKVIT